MAAAPRKKSIILRLALIVFAVYLMVQMGTLQRQLIDKRAELAELNNQAESIELTNQQLSDMLSSGDERDIIVRAAHGKLGFVYPNEEVFTDISGK